MLNRDSQKTRSPKDHRKERNRRSLSQYWMYYGSGQLVGSEEVKMNLNRLQRVKLHASE